MAKFPNAFLKESCLVLSITQLLEFWKQFEFWKPIGALENSHKHLIA